MLAQSAVASMATQPIRLWPADGRLGRARLVAYSTAAYLALGLAAFAGMATGAAGVFVAMLLLLGALAFGVVLVVQRSHDLGLSGWWSIVYFVVPLAAFYWVLAPGTRGPNRFGAPPAPNSTGVIVVACLLPLVFVLGMVAAVALPAYQDYTVRAKVAEVIVALEGCRQSVSSAYRSGAVPPRGRWGCEEGGEAGPYASRLAVDGHGGITVTLRQTGAAGADGRSLTLAPFAADGTPLRALAAPAEVAAFRCLSPSQAGVPERYLPASCRR